MENVAPLSISKEGGERDSEGSAGERTENRPAREEGKSPVLSQEVQRGMMSGATEVLYAGEGRGIAEHKGDKEVTAVNVGDRGDKNDSMSGPIVNMGPGGEGTLVSQAIKCIDNVEGPSTSTTLFQVGSNNSLAKYVGGKKKSHVRKKVSSRPAQAQSHMANDPQVQPMQMDSDFSDDKLMSELLNGKRKAGQEDLWEMCSTSAGDRKKVRCAQVQSHDLNPVAEVGSSQPREQQ